MRYTRSAALVFGALVAAALPLAKDARAAYPEKVITMVVSVPPGAGVDAMGRTLAERLGPRLGQTIVVENKPGASSMVAAGYVARARADGYTLLFAPDTMLMAAHVLPKGAAGGVDPVHDLSPIMITSYAPMVLVVNHDAGFKTVQQFVDFARRSPGATYGTSGTGSHFHIAGLLIERATRVKLTHVSYKGIAEALTGLLGKQIDAMIGVPSGGVASTIEAGRVVPLAVLQEKRSALLPEVPTLSEAGIKGLEKEMEGSLFILAAPAGTPASILRKLNDEGRGVLATPEARKRMTAIGMEPVDTTVDQATNIVRDQYRRNARLVKEFGVHQ
jgi:tripartite-type tricarboxylate transporter receptor subunit TctC